MTAPTIPEIAKELGLSNTTVADALRGTGRVAASTRERVKRYAESAGYRANRSARQLRTGSAEAVGLYIGSDVRNMPFYMPFTFGVMEELANRGLDTTLISHAPANSSAVQVGGLLVIDALPDDPVLESLLRSGVPLVSAGRLASAENPAISSISIDYPTTIRAALELLDAKGGHRPALLAPEPRDPLAWSEQIVTTYHEVCSERGVRPLVIRLPSYATNERLREALDAVQAEGSFDSLFFSWQDIADRSHALLLDRRGEPPALATATLIDSRVNTHYPYDVLVDLDARRFGVSAAELLAVVMEQPGRAGSHLTHPAQVTSSS